MEGIYVFILIILCVVILSLFFFVWRINIGTSKSAGEMKTTLENIQTSVYAQLSILTNFLKPLLSFFRR